MHVEPALPAVFTRTIAAEAGLSRNQVAQRLANGRWRRLVRGAFCRRVDWDEASAEQRHLMLARAILLTRGDSAQVVFSHVTAGVLHGLPVSAATLTTVWATSAAGYDRSTRYGPLLRREVAGLSPEDVREVGGLP